MEKIQLTQLTAIQNELNAPKNQWNDFGKYNYRNAEDIMNALKPLLVKHKCTLVISDKVINVGDHNYIEATAILTNSKGDYVVASASAKEAPAQKGMNDAQVSGSTSSYARKYCLSGLFLIDDSNDPDSVSYEGKPDTQQKDNYEKEVEDKLGGRGLTVEAQSCKNLAELGVWYGNLPKEMRETGSPAVAVKDERKREIMEEQKKAEENTATPEKQEDNPYDFNILKTHTLAKLKEIAKACKVTGYGKMNKATLITSIIKIKENA